MKALGLLLLFFNRLTFHVEDGEFPRARACSPLHRSKFKNSSTKNHLKASFIPVTRGGSPKDGVLCNSALETEETLFHDRKLILQVGEKGFCRAGVE